MICYNYTASDCVVSGQAFEIILINHATGGWLSWLHLLLVSLYKNVNYTTRYGVPAYKIKYSCAASSTRVH